MRRTIGRLVQLVPTLLLIHCALPAGSTWSGKCVGVTDGDTIRVMRAGSAVKIRLEGIDCPESHQDFGTKARQFTSKMVFGKLVKVEDKGQDRYGRTIGRVFVDGEDLGDLVDSVVESVLIS